MHIRLNSINERIEYWRRKTGLEVDFVLDRMNIATEVKLSASLAKIDLHGILAFIGNYNPQYKLVVCNTQHRRLVSMESRDNYDIIPWQDFLDDLWSGKYIK